MAQGGSPSDWVLWATEEPTVRTVYPFHDPNNASDVILYVESTIAATSTDPVENPNSVNGVPTQSTLDAIYKAPSGGNPEEGVVIWDEELQKGRKPITVSNITSSPIEPVPVDIAFTGLSDTSIYTALRAAVDELLYEKRPYVAGAIALEDKNDILLFTEIILLIFNVINGTGATYTSVSMSVNGSPVSTYTFTFGSIPYLRNITNT